MVKKITIIALLMALVLSPDVAMARKKKDKNKDKNKVIEQVIEVEDVKEVDLPITDPATQLYGEWNAIEIKGEEINLPRGSRAYLFFDVNNEMLYGNTGVNSLNATYKMKNNEIRIDDVVVSNIDGGYFNHVEHSFLSALNDVKTLTVTKSGETEYLELNDKHHKALIKMRRQNLDYVNGLWRVYSINGVDVRRCDIKLVNDVGMKTVNITSGTNIINGTIYIDPNVEFGIEFEDLISTRNQWEYIDTETRLLIALEETLFCRKHGEYEVELYTKVKDDYGNEVDKSLVMLEKINM